MPPALLLIGFLPDAQTQSRRVLLFPLALAAQWPDYPSQGVPKGPDGKPNLDAPAPRTADGHVDLSGVWENRRANFGGVVGAAAQPPLGAVRPSHRDVSNIGAGFQGGNCRCTPGRRCLKKRVRRKTARTIPMPIASHGPGQLHEHPQPRKIIQTPAVTVIIYEANSGLRQIFTEAARSAKDVEPWWYGYSVGHWEGDALVVETTGFRDDVWLDINGSPMTNAGKMIEKFPRPTFGKLNIEVTIDDPSAYTKPFTVAFTSRSCSTRI